MSESPKPEDGGKSLEGRAFALSSAEQRDAAMAEAVDYRGDVTIQTHAGQTYVGYVFDRRTKAGKAIVRLMPEDKPGERMEVACDEIASLEFTGRDPAAGKSWETWVKKYVEKKQRGEAASIESEPLE
ncbi:hypothetical protein ACERK3_10340 [Phycisphaerales bacterium AB-hyl4]|uniref:Uncharacterized protein n=1 Tax=Natronomicrosphaera hydrolytica TaxID=3242702 RepID=A0ABV4U525_9BACT